MLIRTEPTATDPRTKRYVPFEGGPSFVYYLAKILVYPDYPDAKVGLHWYQGCEEKKSKFELMGMFFCLFIVSCFPSSSHCWLLCTS